jgi:hypothetical protein
MRHPSWGRALGIAQPGNGRVSVAAAVQAPSTGPSFLAFYLVSTLFNTVHGQIIQKSDD